MSTTRVLRENKAQLISVWEQKIREEIPASRSSSDLVLRNQLPNLIDDLADIFERYEGLSEIKTQDEFEEIVKNSLEHGRHRAASSNYTVKQVLQEYIIFHRTITEFLLEENLYTTEVGIILKYSLETAMLTSASSFTDSLQEMRQKLVGTLAHDIRTPITAAHFALDILDPQIDETRFLKLKNMGLKSLQKALSLLENILDSISVRAGEGMSLTFQKTDIVKELRWVFNEANEVFSNRMVFESDKEEIYGIFDGTAIRRIMENLVTNAVKYGAGDKAIKIRVEDHENSVILSVHNYGNPIPKDEQENIFDFLKRTTKDQSTELESWGMGLTLVKSVAKAHGGDVELISNQEEGTTFYITLLKYANEPGKVRTELNYVDRSY